ncbi:PAS domain S-box protein [Sphaerotilus montanus]|uniref:histidine kinase n=1 Tax=Sphaerotilus montanus TaxID=522889 RepID=A0A7Y9U5I1_9BURK|nr:ATP-binding protein [Sphaerotilus montanus]NYG32968.1 PAS domain S-box-containing protein [Sphaerotilus montanus]NZD56230.1 PAS domain S-box protein [Sphaerotilus montanus]
MLESLAPTYRALFERYLCASDDLQREAVLLAASDLAKSLLPHVVSLDDMLGLHQRTQALLAEDWSAAPAGSLQAQAYRRLASGDVTPLMLAVMLPRQLEETRKASKRWQEEHGKVLVMFEQTDDFVLVFDAQGQLDYLNPAFKHATGWRLHQARPRQAELWPTELPAQHTGHWTNDQIRTDGTSFPATWSISPIRDQDGQLLSHVCIGRDITPLRRLEERVRQNDKLRAVTTLAAGVAHDFNNLLGSIIGLAELCALQAEAGSAQARNLGGILQASNRAAGLVKELLHFARETPLQPHPVALGAWLHHCEPLLAVSLPRHVPLRIELRQDAVVLIDAARIEQVLLNLVKNAGYAMRERSGEVQLVVDRVRLENHPEVVRIQVIDQGEGILPEDLPHIFDPFFTTKPAGDGSGLGLSAAHGIIRHHGGHLEVSSTPGVETVFALLLPMGS